MIVLLGSYSRSWCQSEIDNVVHPPRGVNTTDTTVLVPINMINNLDNSNKVNDNLNKSIERIKRKNRYLVSGGAVCAIAFVVCLLVK